VAAAYVKKIIFRAIIRSALPKIFSFKAFDKPVARAAPRRLPIKNPAQMVTAVSGKIILPPS